MNDRDNELNFDFDSPLENFVVADDNEEEEAFDFSAYAASAERKNSRVKRDRIIEDMQREERIEMEQMRFSKNMQKHSTQNALSRTAPHAITADELKKGFSFSGERRQNAVREGSLFESFNPNKLTSTDAETPNEMKSAVNSDQSENEKTNGFFADKPVLSAEGNSQSGENNYSGAAQLVFKKLQKIRSKDASQQDAESENDENGQDFNAAQGEFDVEDVEPLTAQPETDDKPKFDFSHFEESTPETVDKPKFDFSRFEESAPEAAPESEAAEPFADDNDEDYEYGADVFNISSQDVSGDTDNTYAMNLNAAFDSFPESSAVEDSVSDTESVQTDDVTDEKPASAPLYTQDDTDVDDYINNSDYSTDIDSADSDTAAENDDLQLSFDTDVRFSDTEPSYDEVEGIDVLTDHGEIGLTDIDAENMSADDYGNVPDEFSDYIEKNAESDDAAFENDSDQAAYDESDDIGFDLPDITPVKSNGDDVPIDEFMDAVAPIGKFSGLDEELFGRERDDDYEYDGRRKNKGGDIPEYRNFDDEYDVRRGLISRRRSYLVRTIVTALISLAALLLVCGALPIAVCSPTFWTIMAVLNIAALAVNFECLKSIAYFTEGDAEMDLLPSLTSVASLAQAIFGIFSVTVTSAAAVFTVYSSVILTLLSLGKFIRMNVTVSNFNIIANEDEKTVLSFVDGHDSERIMDADGSFAYRVMTRRNIKDVQEFVEFSTSNDIYDENCSKITLAAILFSSAFAVLFGLMSKDIATAVAGFCGAMCIFTPASSVLGDVVAMLNINSALKNEDAVIGGFLTGEEVANSNVVMVNGADLFSGDNVKLYDIKTFGGLPLDRAIIDASALLESANSTMCGMFSNIAADEKMPLVDSIAYEDKMGLSGWVGGKKTLIGNRMIMETHGIGVPPISVDKKIVANGYFPVYFASEGELAALFIVGYTADPQIEHHLHQLVDSGMTILVKTCDPNLTEEMVADYFGLYRESVKVMSHESEIVYEKAEKTNNSAMLCGSTRGYLKGIIAALRLVKYSHMDIVSRLILIGVALMIFGIFAATGSFEMLNLRCLLLYNCISLLLCMVWHTRYSQS